MAITDYPSNITVEVVIALVKEMVISGIKEIWISYNSRLEKKG